MGKTFKTIRVRVTKDQFNLIQSKAEYNGFKTISAYIRTLALQEVYNLKLIKEMHSKICKND